MIENNFCAGFKERKNMRKKTKNKSQKEKNMKEQRKYQALFWNTPQLTGFF